MSGFWYLITGVGDAGLMLPGALILAIALFSAKAEPAARLWLALFALAALLVAVTKIAFIGWGIGIHRFDFTGISGHSMMSMAVIPVLFFLLAGGGAKSRLAAMGLGIIIAVAIAYSRVMLRMHSPFEALTGALLGLAVSLAFVYTARDTAMSVRLSNMPLLSVSLVVLFLAGYGKAAPSQYVLTQVALFLSGHDKPVTRVEWWAEGWRKIGLPGPPVAQK